MKVFVFALGSDENATNFVSFFFFLKHKTECKRECLWLDELLTTETVFDVDQMTRDKSQ